MRTFLVEDSNSGYEFFSAIAQENSMRCISAKGKSNIFNFVSTNEVDNMIIIADGAAFGSQIARVTNAIRDKNITLYLPESFEWLVLSSGIIYDNSNFPHRKSSRLLENCIFQKINFSISLQ